MRAGFGQFSEPTPDYLEFAAQFGATDVLLNQAQLPSVQGKWMLHDLVMLRQKVVAHNALHGKSLPLAG